MTLGETWYQVYVQGHIFGFSAKDGIILEHPEYKWKGKKLLDYKPVLLQQSAQVFVINPVKDDNSKSGDQGNS